MIAIAELIEFDPQLVLVDSPLPTLLCFSSCSVSVSLSSAYAIGVANIPAIIAGSKNCCYCDCFLIHSYKVSEYQMISVLTS